MPPTTTTRRRAGGSAGEQTAGKSANKAKTSGTDAAVAPAVSNAKASAGGSKAKAQARGKQNTIRQEQTEEEETESENKEDDDSGGATCLVSAVVVTQDGKRSKRKRPLAAQGNPTPLGVSNTESDVEEDGELVHTDDTKVSEEQDEQEESKEAVAGKPRRGRRRMLHDEEQRKQRRKNQCKLNQRRYRARQRGMISTLSLETDTLTDYIHELEAYQQFLANYNQQTEMATDASSSHTRDARPFLVIDQFFQFFQHGFALHSVEISEIQERFVHFVSTPQLVSQGATKAGVDALLLQLKRYTSYHAVFEMHAHSRRVVHSPYKDDAQEEPRRASDKAGAATEAADTATCPWVIQVYGKMHLRLSRDTVMLVYPHIVEDEALSYRVVGHEIEPTFSVIFQFDEHGKMGKLELMVDFAGAFMRLLNSAEQTAELLGKALISPHCELGIDPHEESVAGVTDNKQLSLKFILL
ncbi:hypothetical protein FI667_g10395, partial [Globisporangium splendens]